MRPLESQEKKDRRSNINKVLAGSVLILLMVLSTAGYAFFSSTKTQDVQDLTIPTNQGGLWVVQKGDKQFTFMNSPESVKDIPVNSYVDPSFYQGQSLFISSNDLYLTREVASNIGQYASRVQEACYGSCDKDLPEKDCSENLIVIRSSEEQKVTQENRCIIIEGDSRAVDAFLYKSLGYL